ncbi:EAL domain-containing protein [Geminicoccaceae bacterium 1502E]|nr:EAL domain-containing protein [Geminicoccaceae bacterium 1502E]
MNAVIACITNDHDDWLVVVAALVCLAASWQTMGLQARAAAVRIHQRVVWLAAAATTAGLGFWATHFVAMLGYQVLPTSYRPGLTAFSLLIAINGAGLGIGLTIAPRALVRAAGGALLMLAIVSMHFTGMAAMEVSALQHWDQTFVAWSAFLGMGLGAVAFGLPAMAGRRAISSVLLSLAVLALHFTGMAALRLEYTPLLTPPEPAILPSHLALAVTAVAAVALLAGQAAMRIDRHLAQRDRHEAQRLRHLAEAALEGLAIHEDGVIRDANTSFARLVGLARPEILGRRIDTFLPPALLARIGGVAVEGEVVRPSGEAIPVEILGRPLELTDGPVEVVALRDLRVQRAAEARIRHMARHDQLTGLPNRAALKTMLAQEVETAARDGTSLAVLLIDIAGLRDINSVHGESAGDRMLRETASRLESCVGEETPLGRLAGDEFVVILPKIAGPESAEQRAEALRSAIEDRPMATNAGVQLTALVRIGIALFPSDTRQPADLLARAAEALLAPEGVDDPIRFFDPRAEARRRRRHDMLDALREALAGDGLEAHFQPQIDSASGRLVGCETLLRWKHEKLGPVPPDVFVPLAEEAGLAGALGAWVLRAGCRAAAAWPQPLRVSVNLSADHVASGDVPALVAAVLEETGLPARRLELEITESVLMRDTAAVLATLESLRAMGVTIAMDDFGTGYSSLAYLHAFPFDRMKIDRSFVQPIGKGGSGETIVEAVLALGKALGIATIAEGVETEAQLRFLQERGCNEIQGFLIARPMPAAALIPFLGDWLDRPGAVGAAALPADAPARL